MIVFYMIQRRGSLQTSEYQVTHALNGVHSLNDSRRSNITDVKC